MLLSIEVPLERFLTSIELRGEFRDILDLVEAFGHGWGVVLVLILIAALDPLRRRAIPWVAACAFGSGVAADVIKLLVSRHRPRAMDFADAQVWDTFSGFLPLLSGGSETQSLPSAHSATAVGLAMALTYLYPHGSRLFATLAIGVGFQRFFVGAHFPSDVLVGLSIGYLVSRRILSSKNAQHAMQPADGGSTPVVSGDQTTKSSQSRDQRIAA